MLKPATLVLMGLASAAAIAHALWAPFPASGGNPVLDLIAYHDPGFHTVIRVWYYVAPAIAVVLFGSLGLSVWRVWLQPRAGGGGRKLASSGGSPQASSTTLSGHSRLVALGRKEGGWDRGKPPFSTVRQTGVRPR